MGCSAHAPPGAEAAALTSTIERSGDAPRNEHDAEPLQSIAGVFAMSMGEPATPRETAKCRLPATEVEAGSGKALCRSTCGTSLQLVIGRALLPKQMPRSWPDGGFL